MRHIKYEQVSDLEKKITISADERDAEMGNGSHVYTVKLELTDTGDSAMDEFQETEIRFQHGPAKDNGRNGITNEALLVIVADRLRCFQESPFHCPENGQALEFIEEALRCLNERTKRRMDLCIEGTNTVDESVEGQVRVGAE